MIKRILILTAACALFFQLRSEAQESPSGAIFPKGAQVTANFTGTVWVNTLVPLDSTFRTVVGTVTFEPGARSYWHTHNAGQILLITEGTGYTQERGKPIRVVHKGETITCPPNVEHWHGAEPGSLMTHLSIVANADNGVVNWLRPVTDQEYKGR